MTAFSNRRTAVLSIALALFFTAFLGTSGSTLRGVSIPGEPSTLCQFLPWAPGCDSAASSSATAPAKAPAQEPVESTLPVPTEACEPGTMALCGNGLCEVPETAQTCADCGHKAPPPPSPTPSGNIWKNCSNGGACSKQMVNGRCYGVTDICFLPGAGEPSASGTCGIIGDPSCEGQCIVCGGTPTTPVCGDGLCQMELRETYINCPADCERPVDELCAPGQVCIMNGNRRICDNYAEAANATPLRNCSREGFQGVCGVCPQAPAGPVCGDGICHEDNGETPANCEADCRLFQGCDPILDPVTGQGCGCPNMPACGTPPPPPVDGPMCQDDYRRGLVAISADGRKIATAAEFVGPLMNERLFTIIDRDSGKTMDLPDRMIIHPMFGKDGNFYWLERASLAPNRNAYIESTPTFNKLDTTTWQIRTWTLPVEQAFRDYPILLDVGNLPLLSLTADGNRALFGLPQIKPGAGVHDAIFVYDIPANRLYITNIPENTGWSPAVESTEVKFYMLANSDTPFYAHEYQGGYRFGSFGLGWPQLPVNSTLRCSRQMPTLDGSEVLCQSNTSLSVLIPTTDSVAHIYACNPDEPSACTPITQHVECPDEEEDPAGPVCGNSICEEGETMQTCMRDCRREVCDPLTDPNTGEACGCPGMPECTRPATVCGNSVCESGETTASCAWDCAPSSSGGGDSIPMGCYDSDLYDITVKGTVYQNRFPMRTDSCRSGVDNIVSEYACYNGMPYENVIICPAGRVCVDGACVTRNASAAGNAGSCTDSDGGFNNRVAGTASNGSYSDADQCGSAPDEAQETYCAPEGSVMHWMTRCPAGTTCSDGACR